ncbi:MAG: hypothetical protein AAGJ18_15375 [Bacteroidota bacterium]
MNKFLKFLLYFLGIVLVVGIISYYAFMNAPKASSQGKTADFTLPATELYQAFEQDEEGSNGKYIGKIVQVTGTITEISEDEQGAPVILLAGVDGFGGVLCTLEASQAEKAAKKDLDDAVTIKGVCTGMLMEVVVNKGILVE